MSTNYQEYTVSITLNYEAPVFEEDPKDVNELAKLEQTDLLARVENVINKLVPYADDLKVLVKPVIK